MSLKITANSLFDILKFLNDGNIVCMHENNVGIYYHKYKILEKITDEILIYIDLSKNPGLMDDGEWPWYIKNRGFYEYTSTQLLPTDQDKIVHYSI